MPNQRFNPLPTIKLGDTLFPATHQPANKSFNPLPTIKLGDTIFIKKGKGLITVSIHSQQLSWEIQGQLEQPLIQLSFNPLPTIKLGDTVYADLARDDQVKFQSTPNN